MRIRTLAGPPLADEIIADTFRAIMLTHIANVAGADVDRDESAPQTEEGW